ncbi:hypothetical protein REPUB_Repub02eG0180100 [Reevesia pubescens]
MATTELQISLQLEQIHGEIRDNFRALAKSNLQECKRMIRATLQTSKATRDSNFVSSTNQWSSVFCGIVSRAMTLEVLSTRVAGNYNGALQVMTAKFQVPSPLIPTQENYFVRYCKQHTDGTRAVVDVSLIIYALVQCQSVEEGHQVV